MGRQSAAKASKRITCRAAIAQQTHSDLLAPRCQSTIESTAQRADDDSKTHTPARACPAQKLPVSEVGHRYHHPFAKRIRAPVADAPPRTTLERRASIPPASPGDGPPESRPSVRGIRRDAAGDERLVPSCHSQSGGKARSAYGGKRGTTGHERILVVNTDG